MQYKTKTIALFTLLLLTLFIFGCTTQTSSSTSSTTNSSTLGTGSEETKNNSSLQVSDSCAGIAEKMDQIDCYLALAEETNDTSFCDKATVGDTDAEFWAVVNKYGPDYLIWVDSHQTMCYEGIAKATNNPSICNKVDTWRSRAPALSRSVFLGNLRCIF